LGLGKTNGSFTNQGMAGVSSAHQHIAFAKSKALLGTISGIDRARVSDLVNPNPDQALAPHWRVSRLNTRTHNFLR